MSTLHPDPDPRQGEKQNKHLQRPHAQAPEGWTNVSWACWSQVAHGGRWPHWQLGIQMPEVRCITCHPQSKRKGLCANRIQSESFRAEKSAWFSCRETSRAIGSRELRTQDMSTKAFCSTWERGSVPKDLVSLLISSSLGTKHWID